ncbi:gamma-glutamyl hydrolase 2-like isoform X2 [Aristolochia californica]|uniref:gamma-glutamyl hydrolase 2-like isoform X2 n=1 Tax=Aristolochia californica TaxID=171875 RepID=UPI0035D94826
MHGHRLHTCQCSQIPSCHDEIATENDSQRRTSSSAFSDLWSCLWIPLLLSFSKNSNCAKAQTILLPGGIVNQSRSLTCPPSDPTLYYSPVIGILSHPGDGASGRLSNSTNASYIAASYVKFVESAGARVIPLIYNEPMEVLTEKILAKNDAGDHFPLFAICLGFEILSMVIAEDRGVLETFSATDQASTLQFIKNINLEGTVFRRFSPDLLQKLSTECLVMQNHYYGVPPKKFDKYPALSKFFKILTTSADENSQIYVSTVQGHNYPVTGFQWHPEKNAFEWGKSMIPHTEEAVEVTQHVANFFISEARKSLNRPPTQKVLDNLIYNYSPTYCGKAGKGYDEVYIFS